jgi:toxin ParE1/3/4
MATERAVHQTGRAASDLVALADYFAERASVQVALRFLDAAERAFEQLRDAPRIGALLGLDELPYEGMRRWHVDGFPHLLIVYRVLSDGVEVVRVLHTARDLPAALRAAP